jgi:hypothetical protein
MAGRLDAIAMWFDLKLDTDVTFSTAPDSPTCWEQAIFPILLHHLAAAGKEITLKGLRLNLRSKNAISNFTIKFLVN